MSNTVFITKLPLVESNQELEKIKKLYPNYDPYFITSGCIKERREIFDKLWNSYKPYADSNFLSEIKHNFHQRSWEMYIGNVLLKLEMDIQSQNEGPDFVINKTSYIECVAPTKGDPSKTNSVPEMFIATTPEKMCVQDVPVDKIILRITQSIKYKSLEQYKNWKNKKWFDLKMPFVIAINIGDLGHVDDSSMPNTIKALFGFQFMRININTKKTDFTHRNVIEKTEKKPVPVNYFACPDFDFISGVLFSDKNILNHPKIIGDDCIFVNNPFAKNPINKSFGNLFKNWVASKDDAGINLKKNY